VRLGSGVLHTESFDKGAEDVYGPRWESTIPGQYCSLEGCRENTTYNPVIVGIEVRLCWENTTYNLVWICCPIIPLKVQWFLPQGYVYLHDAVDKRISTDSLPWWTMHVEET